MPKGKILVIDDEPETRESISQALVSRGYEVTLASSADDGLLALHSSCRDLVILDTDIPGSDCTQTCMSIRATSIAPIILLSPRFDETELVLCLGAGADVYLIKPVHMFALLAHVEAAIRREVIYTQHRAKMELLHIQDLILDIAGCELRRNGASIRLSPTEFRLVRTLAESAGRVLTRSQLLDSVWDLRSDEVFSRTVDVHIGRLRRKIGDDPISPRYILTIPGHGYKMPNR